MTMAFVVRARSVTGTEREFGADGAMLALSAALAAEFDAETYLCWDGTDALCALDLDAEPGYEATESKLVSMLDDFQPRPSLAWITHHGGLRLVYANQDPYSADEAAAVAALNLRVPYRALELKRETRHPGAPSADGRRAGPVHKRDQSFDASSLRRHLGVYEATDSEVQAWLEERGFEPGSRYDHTRCPASPSDRGGRQPVFVGERGVCCFVCEADGVCVGSSKPGFFPYSHFCGRRRASHLYRCLENATHWEHARFVLDHALDLPPQFSRLVYSAGITMLRRREDAQSAFMVGRDFVRIDDRWTNLNGEAYIKDVKPLLAQLPACNYWNGDGKKHPDRGRMVLFEQTFDLARYGYPSLVPVFGCRLWPPDRDSSQVPAVVQTRELAVDEASELRPKYVSAAKRMPEAEMWVEFDRAFPGLCHGLLELLVAARGVAEGACSMPPMVFVTGPSGAAKSTTSFIAASVCGDRNTEVVWTADSNRLRQAIIDSSATGSYVTFNEVLKEARSKVKESAHAMDYVLNLTPDSVSHYMYVGPVRLGRLPVFVWTDTDLPAEVKTNAQLARRLVHVPLPSEVDWETAWRNVDLKHARSFRLSSQRRADACDALLSSVVDRFLRPPREFSAIAAELGFGRMADSEEADERREVLVRLFDEVCRAPPLTGSDADRWKGRGWAKVDRDMESPLRDAWLTVADETFVSSRAATEVDWAKVAKLVEPARLEVRSHGLKVAVRFRSVAGTRTAYRVNGELRK